MASFNNKQQNSLAWQECDDEPMYRRIVFEGIEKLNKDPRRCTSIQQKLVLQSVNLICHDTRPMSEEALGGAVDNILTFFLSVFHSMLSSRKKSSLESVEEDNLKMIIRLVGVLALKSEFFLHKIEKRQIFRRFIDRIISRSSSVTMSRRVEEGGDVVSDIVDIALKSQLLHELLLAVKTVLASLSEHLEESTSGEECYTEVISHHLSRVENANFILVNSRTYMRSLIGLKAFSTEDKTQFIEAQVITRLTTRCLQSDLTSCSHVLKTIIIFSEQPLLQEIMLQEYSAEFITLYLATMRCEVDLLHDLLMKLWLTQRICTEPLWRNFLFCSEGVILEIMAVMREVNTEAGDSLSILSPFCNDMFFRDMTLTTAQIIQYFGNCFQSGESDLLRAQAGAVLKLFANGLTLYKNIPMLHLESVSESESESLPNIFIDSGLLFCLVNVISAEDSTTESVEVGVGLLCTLVADASIREVFVAELLGILHCLVTSVDSNKGRRNLFACLIAVLEVLSRHPSCYPRLIESDILINLAEHLKDTLSTEAICSDSKVSTLLRGLRIFDTMASNSKESCQQFKQMELEVFLGLFLQHENKEVREMVSLIVAKLGKTPWKARLQKVIKLF